MGNTISKSAAIRRLLCHDPEMPPKVIKETLRSLEGIEVDDNLIKVVRRNWRRLTFHEKQSKSFQDGKFRWQGESTCSSTADDDEMPSLAPHMSRPR